MFGRRFVNGDKGGLGFDVDVLLFTFKQRPQAALQQRGVVALRRFRRRARFPIRQGAPPPRRGERLDGGQFGGAVKLQGAAVRVLLRQGQAAALAFAADGAVLFSKARRAQLVVFRAFGQRVFNPFRRRFRSGLPGSPSAAAPLSEDAAGARQRRGAAALVRLRQPEAVVSRRRSAARRGFFHHHSAQKISVSEFKLHERALLIIEEAFRFVKEDFSTHPARPA